MTPLSPTALEAAAKALDELPLSDGDRFGTLIYMSDYVHPGSRDDMRCASLKILNAVATAAITAYLAQREKEGFVEVPREPTVAMRSAVAKFDWESKCDVDWADGYRVMITAASQEQNDASDR